MTSDKRQAGDGVDRNDVSYTSPAAILLPSPFRISGWSSHADWVYQVSTSISLSHPRLSHNINTAVTMHLMYTIDEKGNR